ncbi:MULTISPECIES: hypothetical protein [unclassified Clostridium]|uniref:hypothetical protein n=1 Tax=unclassified Clostridium TaxID=2614128 RepID=UPI00189A5010|nr:MULTISPECIES: hypothetical protein [unclassified Clostridium]MCR1951243.1 hypothetical protein [Clostridium sp. DSM 100503]
MNFNGWGNFEDLLRSCGYNNNNNNNTNNDNNTNNNNNNTTGCNDIPPGPFQTLPPELFAIIGEIIGNIIAGNIPFNIQNLIGNWLELVGQVILVFNAQQQYFESGPGRYYDPKNYNISNPFCSNNSTSTNGNTSSTSASSSTNSSNSNDINISKIEKLEKQIEELTKELTEIKTLLKEK